jgi:Beta galactosidase small chain
MKMEPKGESMVAELLKNEAGASLEVGGAHWFASTGGEGEAEAEPQQEVDGTMAIEVHIHNIFQNDISPASLLLHHKPHCNSIGHDVSSRVTAPQLPCIFLAATASTGAMKYFFNLQVFYTFGSDGSVHMSWQVDTRRFMPAKLQGELNSLPRIGLELALPAALQHCVWLGRCAPSPLVLFALPCLLHATIVSLKPCFVRLL